MSTPMMVDEAKCNGCGLCLLDCPKGTIRRVSEHLVAISEGCVGCQICAKLCRRGALRPGSLAPGTVSCDHCPVLCQVPPGHYGSCHRYRNVNGEIQRDTPLHVFEKSGIRLDPLKGLPTKPLLTGVGAGTNLQLLPARIIAEEAIEGVDVVTAVTEAVLSFSGVRVKLDVDAYIGDEGRPVKRDKKTVGFVTASEYGSRTMSVGGVTLLKGLDGFTVARTMIGLANQERVPLEVEGGAQLEIGIRQHPRINGEIVDCTTFGCGSSVGKLFSRHLLKVVDDCILLDMGITGHMADHHAALGARRTGIQVFGKRSTAGRYLVPSGKGWGGTCIEDPRQAIAGVDKKIAWPGLRILVSETKARQAAYFVLNENLEPVEQPLPPEVQETLNFMGTYCEPSTAHVFYVGGIGGGVRGALHPDHPPAICEAIKQGRIKLTAAGQETFVFPGANLIFMVNAGRMPRGCFAWVPTPATVVPLEFTMTKKTFLEITGYPEAVRPLEAVLREFPHVSMEEEEEE